jgi:hypothetical protein
MSNAPVKIHHLWNSDTIISDYASTNGVLTFVSQETQPGMFSYGVSICMPGDQFTKAMGIENATRRLTDHLSGQNNGLSSTFVYDGPKRYVDIKFMMLISALANMRPSRTRTHSLPKWAIRTLKNEIAFMYDETFVGFGM